VNLILEKTKKLAKNVR